MIHRGACLTIEDLQNYKILNRQEDEVWSRADLVPPIGWRFLCNNDPVVESQENNQCGEVTMVEKLIGVFSQTQQNLWANIIEGNTMFLKKTQEEDGKIH